MAAIAVTVTFRGQKATRQNTVAGQADTWTVTSPTIAGPATFLLQLQPSTAIWYHSTPASVLADGFPIAAGATFNVPLLNGTTVFGIAAQAANGVIDAVLL